MAQTVVSELRSGQSHPDRLDSDFDPANYQPLRTLSEIERFVLGLSAHDLAMWIERLLNDHPDPVSLLAEDPAVFVVEFYSKSDVSLQQPIRSALGRLALICTGEHESGIYLRRLLYCCGRLNVTGAYEPLFRILLTGTLRERYASEEAKAKGEDLRVLLMNVVARLHPPEDKRIQHFCERLMNDYPGEQKWGPWHFSVAYRVVSEVSVTGATDHFAELIDALAGLKEGEKGIALRGHLKRVERLYGDVLSGDAKGCCEALNTSVTDVEAASRIASGFLLSEVVRSEDMIRQLLAGLNDPMAAHRGLTALANLVQRRGGASDLTKLRDYFLELYRELYLEWDEDTDEAELVAHQAEKPKSSEQ